MMLQQIYASDCALIFDDQVLDSIEFGENNSRRGLVSDDSCECGILNRSKEKFHGYLTYRVSMGVAYLAEMHRRSSPRFAPIHRQVDDLDWTQPKPSSAAAVKNHSRASYLDFDCSFILHLPQWSTAYRASA